MRDDRELIAAIAEGDRDALAELYEQHAAWLVLRLSRRCRDRDVVDQVVQDTFLGVWRGAGSYNGSGEVGAWIWGIGSRRLVDHLRRRPRKVEVLSPDLSDGTTTEDLVLANVEHGDLGGALAALSPEFRAVIQATLLHGLSTREAAAVLGIPVGTVKTRAMRARAQLRKALA
jgi:RNA polymerase sigma-70 factor, ECF subfamily